MRTVQGKTITGRIMEEDSPPIENLVFVKCRFQSCFTAPRHDFDDPAVIRNIRIESCTYQACDLYTALVENVEVDGFVRSGRHPAFTWGSRFRHVKLKGVIGSPLVRPDPSIHDSIEGKKGASAWRLKLAKFYAGVDWALDIAEAKFTTFVTFAGVPADRIRINPEHQVVVERARILSPEFRYKRLHSLAQIVVDSVVKQELDDLVVASGTGGRKLADDMTALKLLRASGATRPE